MFDYPSQAGLHRILPKSKIYEFAKPSRAVRDLFISQIREIVWKYKLSPETVNLPARQGVQEIQVFGIALKSGELSQDVLRTIDRAIPSPLFFQLSFQDSIKFIAGHKRAGNTGVAKAVVDTYFETAWQLSNIVLPPLPVALDLIGLYEQMLRRHIHLPPRPAESLQTLIERVNEIRNKENECRRLGARLRQEVQFNRKVEINAVLRLRQAELAHLQAP